MVQSLTKLKEFAGCALALGRGPQEKWEILWRQTKNIRVRLSLARYHSGTTYALSTRYGRLHLRDNFGDVTNLPDLFHRNVYRCGRLEGSGVILDVGANIGLFSAWAMFHNPGRTIYCFEALESNARLIRMNCPQAIVVRAAMGRMPGVQRFGVDADGVMASSIPTRWPTSEMTLQVITLDDFAQERGIREVSFFKLDTEGMELDILDGGRDTLRITRQIAIETHGDDRHSGTRERLREAGFVLELDEFSGETGLLIGARPAPGTP